MRGIGWQGSQGSMLNGQRSLSRSRIKKIVGQLVFSESGRNKHGRKGEEGGSGSEYKPNDDEDPDDADEVVSKEETAMENGRIEA